MNFTLKTCGISYGPALEKPQHWNAPAALKESAMKGLICPECNGDRLLVIATRKPCRGLVVQYRRCSACEARIVTEIRLRKTAVPDVASDLEKAPNDSSRPGLDVVQRDETTAERTP